jgi:hypothetical protein
MMDKYRNLFTPSSTLEVKLGYANGLFTRTFRGVLQSTTLATSGSQMEMSLEAVGSAWTASRIDGAITVESRSIIDTLRLLCDSRGLELFYLNNKGEEIPLLVVPNDLSNLRRIISNTFTDNDLLIINRLIRISAGYDFFCEANRIIILNLLQQGLTRDIPTFMYMGALDIEKNQFPLLSYNSSNSQNAYIAAVHRVQTKDVDLSEQKVENPIQKTTASGDLNISFTKPFGLPDVLAQSVAGVTSGFAGAGSILFNQTSFREDNNGVNMPLASTDNDREQKAAYEKRRGELMSGLQAEIETMGHPVFRPGMQVNIGGLSQLFSGRYYVVGLRHQASAGEFKTSMELITTGTEEVLQAHNEEVQGPLSVKAAQTGPSLDKYTVSPK